MNCLPGQFRWIFRLRFLASCPQVRRQVVSRWLTVFLCPPPQLPAEVTSRVQRERCSLQTTHATTPEARAASTTSSSPGTSVSTSNITPSEPQNGVTCRLLGRCRRLQEGSVEYEVRRGGGDDALCSLRVSLLMKRVVDEEMEASSQS